MNVLLRPAYLAPMLYQAVDALTSNELPKRPDYVMEVASSRDSTAADYEVLFTQEVLDARIADRTQCPH